MRTSMLAVAVILTAVFLAGCYVNVNGGGFKASFTRSETLTAPLTDITSLDVNTNVGKIELKTGDVAEAQITAQIKVKADSEEKAQELAERVRVEVEPSGRTLVIKAEKPSGFGRNELAVDFTIVAPAALAIKATTNVGDIYVTDFTGRVEARCDVGQVTCTGLRGDADLHTNVGNVRAEYSPDAPAAISVDASANVGDVELRGPKDISAKVAAETNVGSIDSDRPLTIRGSLGKSIHASLGNGEGRIKLGSNVGSVRIR
ncbi:MAG: DUF4097 family beta strand repeat-containing protein [Solirubrobacterales bacterium]